MSFKSSNSNGEFHLVCNTEKDKLLTERKCFEIEICLNLVFVLLLFLKRP